MSEEKKQPIQNWEFPEITISPVAQIQEGEETSDALTKILNTLNQGQKSNRGLPLGIFTELKIGAGENVFRVTKDGIFLGASNYNNAPFQVSMAGTVKMSSLSIGSLISIQGWQFSGTFSATDYNTVAWSAGTVTLSCGASFSINAGSTGNMTERKYIYLDIPISETELQITGTASSAVGANKILIAVAEDNADNTSDATFQVFGGTGGILLTTDNIAANTVTADKISVTTLSSISANIGSITSGTVTSATVRTSAGDGRVELNPDDTLKFYDTNGDLKMQLKSIEGGGEIMHGTEHGICLLNDRIESSKDLTPGEDNSYTLGRYNMRWSDLRTMDAYVYDDLTVDDLIVVVSPGQVQTNSLRPYSGSDVNFYGNCIPWSAHAYNLGTSSDYWDAVNYKSLNDRGCLGVFDEGVELCDGRIVSDLEALKSIQKDEKEMTVYGVPRFKYSTMPKAVYKPVPIAKEDIIKRDLEGKEFVQYKKGEKAGADGAELSALISIMIGALKELDSRLTKLEK